VLKRKSLYRQGLNFTNLCATGEKLPAHSVRQKICHPISLFHNLSQICEPKKAKKPNKYVGEIDHWLTVGFRVTGK